LTVFGCAMTGPDHARIAANAALAAVVNIVLIALFSNVAFQTRLRGIDPCSLFVLCLSRAGNR
jgi:hypothetical protein